MHSMYDEIFQKVSKIEWEQGAARTYTAPSINLTEYLFPSFDDLKISRLWLYGLGKSKYK